MGFHSRLFNNTRLSQSSVLPAQQAGFDYRSSQCVDFGARKNLLYSRSANAAPNPKTTGWNSVRWAIDRGAWFTELTLLEDVTGEFPVLPLFSEDRFGAGFVGIMAALQLITLSLSISSPPTFGAGGATVAPLCPPGFHKILGSSKCRSCESGFYMDTYNMETECHECTSCPGKVVVSQCNGTHNAICICPSGFVENKDSMCSSSEAGLPSQSNVDANSLKEHLSPSSSLEQHKWKSDRLAAILVGIVLSVAGLAVIIVATCCCKKGKSSGKKSPTEISQPLVGIVQGANKDDTDGASSDPEATGKEALEPVVMNVQRQARPRSTTSSNYRASSSDTGLNRSASSQNLTNEIPDTLG